MRPETHLPPEERAALERLRALADSIEPRTGFEAGLESRLREAHRPHRATPVRSREMLHFAGWAAAALALALLLNWLIQAGLPTRIPAANPTPTASRRETPEAQGTPQASPGPTGAGLDWRGTTLFLNTELPAGPEQASVLILQPEQAASLQSAQEMAARFGIQGQIYQAPSEIPGTAAFMVTDGRQRLQVRSDRYFTYYPDYAAYLNSATTLDVPDAEARIAEFMQAHGISTPYRVEKNEIYGGFYALPLGPGDLSVHHQHFKPSGWLFKFGEQGILAVEASLVGYSEAGTFALRPAQAALDMVLDSGVQVGLLEGMVSAPGDYPVWYRTFPMDAVISLYMHLTVAAPVEGQTPFIALDGYPARGNLAGLESLQGADLVHVRGQFRSEDGMQVFEVESWEPYSGYEDGLVGMLERQGEQVIFAGEDGQTLVMPDLPADVSLPLENAFVLGVPEAGTFQWKSIDMRMVHGGGGGGGGGLGLYKLNLSGTPIPFPTATPQATPLPAGQGAQYTVQQGDTLSSIAQSFGTTQEALAQANGLTDPGTLFVGQVLLIPGSTAQQVVGWRGLLNITLLVQPDGSKQTQFGFAQDGGAGFYILQGDLAGLASYQNRPVTIWGVIDGSQSNGSAVIKVDRYEIPYPDLGFTILHGTESNGNAGGEQVTLLTIEGGQSYVMLGPDGMPFASPAEPGSEDRLVEALAIPGETYAGQPAIRVFSSAMAVNPKNGLPANMPITADQPYTVEGSLPEVSSAPTAAIEKVELVYFIPDPRYEVPDPNAGPAYIQPMWRFSGHYSNGDVFEILVQALRQEYLSPEVQTIQGPG